MKQQLFGYYNNEHDYDLGLMQRPLLTFVIVFLSLLIVGLIHIKFGG